VGELESTIEAEDGWPGEAATFTVTVADEAPKPALPPYEAVMTLFPVLNWLALTVREAVAVPPEPERLPVPSDVLPSVKVTEPVGVALPLAAVTVAVSAVLLLAVMLAGAAVTVVVVATMVGMGWLLFHCVTRLYVSTEPSPVARSYPGPAV
jgi:hypothetical protein